MGEVVPAAVVTPEAYAYWGSFLAQDGAWTFAPVGPSARTVQDGSVEGWRFALVGTDAAPRPPRALPGFEELCAGVAPAEGEVRVGVVLDPGRPADAPPGTRADTPSGSDALPPPVRGTCAAVPDGASGEAVLAAVAELRTDAGVLCAVDGYPADVCQPEVPLTREASAPDEAVAAEVVPPPDLSEAGVLAPPQADQAAPEGPWTTLGLVGALVVTVVVSGVLVLVAVLLARRVRRPSTSGRG